MDPQKLEGTPRSLPDRIMLVGHFGMYVLLLPGLVLGGAFFVTGPYPRAHHAVTTLLMGTFGLMFAFFAVVLIGHVFHGFECLISRVERTANAPERKSRQ